MASFVAVLHKMKCLHFTSFLECQWQITGSVICDENIRYMSALRCVARVVSDNSRILDLPVCATEVVAAYLRSRMFRHESLEKQRKAGA